jgi:hypothetical protein
MIVDSDDGFERWKWTHEAALSKEFRLDRWAVFFSPGRADRSFPHTR